MRTLLRLAFVALFGAAMSLVPVLSGAAPSPGITQRCLLFSIPCATIAKQEGPITVAAVPQAQRFCGTGSDGAQYIQVYTSALSRWCVASPIWDSEKASFPPFFRYGDAVIATLNQLFGPIGRNVFTFEATLYTGGAHTGSDFGPGDSITGDAFVNNAFGVDGFYGYVFPLHEAINDWTGNVTDNWPTDWWADDQSPFPNSLDAFIMQHIGTAQKNSTLLAAARAQTAEWATNTDSSYNGEVVMFNTFFAKYGGFPAFRKVFALIRGDGIHWKNVAPNPSALLTEYVIAYLQLGFRTTSDLTQSSFVAAGVGTNQWDKTDPSYTVDPSVVLAIANAHCSIKAAGRSASAALRALQSGKYQNALAIGGTQTACPSECIWDAPRNRCTAPW